VAGVVVPTLTLEDNRIVRVKGGGGGG
jgi:hypothetical protein